MTSRPHSALHVSYRLASPRLTEVAVSRARGTKALQAGCASIPTVASLAWIIERLSEKQNVIGSAIERVAHYGALLVAGLLMSGIFIWLFDRSERIPIEDLSDISPNTGRHQEAGFS